MFTQESLGSKQRSLLGGLERILDLQSGSTPLMFCCLCVCVCVCFNPSEHTTHTTIAERSAEEPPRSPRRRRVARRPEVASREKACFLCFERAIDYERVASLLRNPSAPNRITNSRPSVWVTPPSCSVVYVCVFLCLLRSRSAPNSALCSVASNAFSTCNLGHSPPHVLSLLCVFLQER